MLMESLDLALDEPSSHPVLGDASTALPPKANDVRAVVAPGDSVARGPGGLRPREARTRAAFAPIRIGETRNASRGE